MLQHVTWFSLEYISFISHNKHYQESPTNYAYYRRCPENKLEYLHIRVCTCKHMAKKILSTTIFFAQYILMWLFIIFGASSSFHTYQQCMYKYNQRLKCKIWFHTEHTFNKLFTKRNITDLTVVYKANTPIEQSDKVNPNEPLSAHRPKNYITPLPFRRRFVFISSDIKRCNFPSVGLRGMGGWRRLELGWVGCDVFIAKTPWPTLWRGSNGSFFDRPIRPAKP